MSSKTKIVQLFALGLEQHRAGKLDEAQRIYRDVLAREPRHFDSLHLCGVAALQQGHPDVAIDMIGKAIALNGNVATFHNNIAEALRTKGRLDDAAMHASRAIELEPNFAEAHVNLGNVLKQQGKGDEALGRYKQALTINPSHADAHVNTGVIYIDNGRLDEALAAFGKALAIRPDFPAAEMNLGIALHQQGRWDEAAAHYRKALTLQPNYVLALMNLGDTLFEQGRIDEAIGRYEAALHLTMGASGPDSKAVKPAESLAALSTGGRPLYPVEDKCVMSLVRAQCWRASLHEWRALCAGARRHDGLCAESRYELTIRTAISQWIERDYGGLAASLDGAEALLAQIPTPNANVKNSRAYGGFLRALLTYAQANPEGRVQAGQMRPVAVIGDSHCLTFDGTPIKIDGAARAGDARLIMGCKAWHLGNDAPNRFKERLAAIMQSLPEASTVICTFGEIDCRLDEGIFPHFCAVGGSLDSLVAKQVESYVSHVASVAARRSIRVAFLNVPAPHFDAMPPRLPSVTDGDKDVLITIIDLFNTSLARSAAAKGHRVIDVHRLTAGTNGASHGRHHLDDIHLRPDVLAVALP